MGHSIQTVYIIHHSHTDIGYTDLQERIIDGQINYIRTVLEYFRESSQNNEFRWNCETYFCVEQFLKTASEKEKEEFFHLVREKKIGLSGSYLNFTDLLDTQIYNRRLEEITKELQQNKIEIKTAMFADINGISMGQRDTMLDYGIEFLYTNIHTHHGMYPLYKNQTAFWWENKEKKKLLVWNGEHYNLGNTLGIKPIKQNSSKNNSLKEEFFHEQVEVLHQNLETYLNTCQENGYSYDFMISSVSGVFSDNAPPNLEILHMINAYNKKYGSIVKLKMVSLQELYDAIKDKIQTAPVYQGDMTDWWANGVGSTPYAVKHYREAKRLYHLCERLDKNVFQNYPENIRKIEDNLMLYAEHTWGHSATILDPYDTMVFNLDMRKNSYASKAHENASFILNKLALDNGDIMRYYNNNGKIKVKNTNNLAQKLLVEFYIESHTIKNITIIETSTKKTRNAQLSYHSRGTCICFIDKFEPWQEKEYEYQETEKPMLYASNSYNGIERFDDIIKEDTRRSKLPYEFENQWFYISYYPYEGIKKFINKKTGQNMIVQDNVSFFTPIYEVTNISNEENSAQKREEERRNLGRNIRGKNANSYPGILKEIKCKETGKVFTTLEFIYDLQGTKHCSVILKLYEEIPKIDFKLRLAKELCEDIESIYLPLSLHLPNKKTYLKKGTEPFLPGVEQLPGTCMEYYMSDDGIVFISPKETILIQMKDTPLITMGELKHHPIQLCDGKLENNEREIYSWVMNNTWETNFKLDLSGYGEFQYSLCFTDTNKVEEAFHELEEMNYVPYVFIIE